MGVPDGQTDLNGRSAVDGFAGVINQLVIQSLGEAMILQGGAAPGYAGGCARAKQNCGEVNAAGLPVLCRRFGFQHVDAANHLIHPAEAEAGHDGPDLPRHKEEEINDVFRLTLKLRAQLWILGGDADGAGIEMALAHHDAAEGYQGRSGEAEFLSAQQGRDCDITTGGKFAIRLQANAAAQIIHDQNLLRFGEAQFPGRPGVLERGER